MDKQKGLIGFVYNAQMPKANPLVKALASELGVGGRSWTASAEKIATVGDRLRDTALIVTVGGDGTILRTARVAAPEAVPILGVNMGRVGFMTELDAGDALAKVREYVDGRPWIEERTMVQGNLAFDSGGEPLEVHALNDLVVSRGAMARLVQVEATVDGALLTTYRADGVIVATATGSTGYALAVGGPIMHPRSREMLLLPIAGHMCLQTPLVLMEESVVELRIINEAQSIMSVDGFVEKALRPNDRVTVRRSPHVARFLRLGPPHKFYSTLTRRLGIMER